MVKRVPWRWTASLGGIASIDEGMWRETFQVTDADYPMSLETCVAGYTRWIADVKAHVPAAQLLVFNAREGWAPLCTFLGVAADKCPATPFPRINEAADMLRMLAVITFVADYFAALVGVAAALLVLLVRRLSRRGAKRKAA